MLGFRFVSVFIYFYFFLSDDLFTKEKGTKPLPTAVNVLLDLLHSLCSIYVRTYPLLVKTLGSMDLKGQVNLQVKALCFRYPRLMDAYNLGP